MMLLAGCMVADDQGRVLLVHRNTPDLTQWEIPGGKVEPGEQPRVAAIREIKEELGVEVKVIEPLGVTEFDFRGTPCEYHYFRATIVAGKPELRESKHDAWAYVDLDSTEHDLSRGAKGLKRVLA